MRKVAACKEPGCDQARPKGMDFCVQHLAETRVCNGTVRTTGKPCERPAMRGLRVCQEHGGINPSAKRKSQRAKALTDMQKFVQPHAKANPIGAFETEVRRALGRIAWYDDQLARLASADDLVYGLTKEEQIAAAEHPGT
ncbi:MAG: hypothetical protein ACRDQA_30800, partial [Nocardioidaceae bacterium]